MARDTLVCGVLPLCTLPCAGVVARADASTCSSKDGSRCMRGSQLLLLASLLVATAILGGCLQGTAAASPVVLKSASAVDDESSPTATTFLGSNEGRGSGSSELQSGCSCYVLRNPLCCEHSQPVCVCRDVCYNGSVLVRTFHDASLANRRAGGPNQGFIRSGRSTDEKDGNVLPCSPEMEARLRAEFSPDERFLRLVECWHDTELYMNLLSHALRENHHGHRLGVRPRDWLRTRERVEWRRGSTLLNVLTPETTNIAHMIMKVGALQLAARIPTTKSAPLGRRFDRILMPRAPILRQVIEKGGAEGWLAQVVHMFASMALEGSEGRQEADGTAVKVEDFVGGPKEMLAKGRLELESMYERASESQPMCFERVVFSGSLKAVTYLGGEAMAQQVQHRISKEHNVPLQLRPAQGMSGISTYRVKMLFISRQGASKNGRKRALTQKSRSVLLNMMQDIGYDVKLMDFSGLSFIEQYKLCQWADVILMVHGAGATNPASFARPATVLIELVPFPLMMDLYHYMSINSGLIYFMHMLTKGPTQVGDLEHAAMVNGLLGPFICLNDRACHAHYNDKRIIVLGQEDLSELQQQLVLAHSIANEVGLRGPTSAAAQLRPRMVSGHLCLAATRNKECRTNLIHWPAAVSGECILMQNCTREAVLPPVVTDFEA